MLAFLPPHKRTIAIAYLAYMPIWIGIIGFLMFSKAFATWGDVGMMTLGIGCALPVIALPLVLANGRHAQQAIVFLVGMSVLQNHFGSWFFFHSLGMEYHFPVTWIANRVPIFLHPLTVAYFSTYYTVMTLALAWFEHKAPQASPVTRWLVIGLLSYAMAFAETFFMDVDLLQQYFTYASRARALWFGSIAYGTLFLCTFPLYYSLDEKTEWKPFLWRLLGANMLILITYELYGWAMGPAPR